MENKFQKKDESGDEEPKRKKFKSEREEVEVPKMTLSKNGKSLKKKLKLSNKKNSKNLQNKDISLPSRKMNTGFKSSTKKNTLKNKNCDMKRKSEKKIEQTVLTNSLLGKIRVRDIRTINENFDSINKDMLLFDKDKSDVFHTDNVALTFRHFGTNQLTLQHFELLHKKYFNKYVLDTIVIINNIIFMNLLTIVHCISRINWTLGWKDKHKMRQNIQFQSNLCIKYVNTLDNVLKKNCTDIISNFEDTDYEHAFLMLVLSLFASLKMFGSNVFKNSSVILKKLERLQWESVKREKFDHNRIRMTFKSDAFCSCYDELSKLIGEGSYTDPNIVKWWKLFCTPAVFKTTYFRSAVEAITNAADIDKVVSLIDTASNNVRLQSNFKNDENASMYKKKKFEKLIALVNNSARENVDSNEIIQPCASEFDTLDQINQ